MPEEDIICREGSLKSKEKGKRKQAEKWKKTGIQRRLDEEMNKGEREGEQT